MKNLCRSVIAKLCPVYKIGGIVLMTLMVFPSLLCAQLDIHTDRSNANYEIGETMNFVAQSTVSGTATYSITHDKFAEVITSGTINLQAGVATNIPFNLNEAGIVLCAITQNGQTVKAAAAFDPEALDSFEPEPDDFDAFWSTAKAELAALPIDAQLNPYNSTAYSTTYRVNLATVANRRVYGYISIPNGTGPFPAILTLPSFGESPNVALPDESIAEKAGAISMSISIHNTEPDQFDPQSYKPDEVTDPNNMYFKWVVLAGIRAIDYISSRPDFNGQVGVAGVSQGGGIAMMLAGVDDRVKMLIQSNSTHCQHSGLKYERASGFPYYLSLSRAEVGTAAHELATLKATAYYDAIYFARRYNGPSLTIISYEDETCPPATVFAAYNQLRGPKVLMHARELGHVHPPEYWNGRFDFFRQHFPATQNTPWPWPGTTTGYLAEAGSDQTINLDDGLQLSGSVSINGAATTSFPAEWTVVEGPGTVDLDNPTAYATTAKFSQPGRYVLRFSANDFGPLAANNNFYTISDDLEILVNGTIGDVPPKVTLSTAQQDVSAAFMVKVDFNENISGLTLSDFEVVNGTVSNLTGSGNRFDVQINPIAEGEVTVRIPANRVVDTGNNGNEPSNLLTVNFKLADVSKPQVTLSTASSQVSAAFNVSVSFNEEITGLGLMDFVINNGSAANLSGSGSQYTLNIQPLAEGEVSVLLPAERVVDLAGNANWASNELKVEYKLEDLQRPSVVLSSPISEVSSDFNITATFDEPIIGLEMTDFVISNGNAIGLSGSGTSYTLSVQPNVEGEVKLQLPASRATDLAGNFNLASNELKLEYKIEDLQKPSAVLSTSVTEVMGNFSLTATFSEPILGLEAADFVINNGSALNLNGNGSIYTLNVQPIVEGEISIILPADRANDLAGNTNLASNELKVTFKIEDLQQPSVALLGPLSEVSNEFEVAVNFSEEITGFEEADVAISNGTIINLSGSGSLYTLNILPVLEGEIHIQIPADKVFDLAGNGNLISNELEVIYKKPDSQQPSVTLSTGSTSVAGAFEVQVSFDENVSGLQASDFAVSNGTALGLVGFDNFYRLQVMPTNEGEVSVVLPAAQAQDLAGNANLASNLLIVQYLPPDLSKPTAVLSTIAPVFNGTFTVTVKFNENIIGLDIADFATSNADLISLSGSERVYRLTVSPQVPGKVFVQLLATTITDEAGNANDASNVLEIEYVDPSTAFLDFNATGKGRRVLFNWTTNTEYKNASFAIERSSDNINYEVVLEQTSLNDNSTLVNYQGEDPAPNTGDNYYRLKQIFKDSSYVYSLEEKVTLDFDVNSFVIFPNPAQEEVFVNFREFVGEAALIEVKDQIGNLVLVEKIDALPLAPVRFSLSKFHDGVYYLSFSIKGTKRFSRKLVVIR